MDNHSQTGAIAEDHTLKIPLQVNIPANVFVEVGNQIDKKAAIIGRRAAELNSSISHLDEKLGIFTSLIETFKAATEKQNQEAIQKLAASNEELKHTLDLANSEITRLTKELLDKDATLEAANRALDASREKFSQLEERKRQAEVAADSVKEVFRDYEPVLNALKKCALFSDFVNTHALGAGDTNALFRLARMMGETYDFASEIHKIAVEAKKISKEPITVEEGAVYKAISCCYAKIWGIDFDVFVCPDEQATDEPYKTTSFNRNDMINLLDPRDKVSQYAQEVYVPMLRTKERGLISPARVKAGNNMK